jgi:hypothetical protein
MKKPSKTDELATAIRDKKRKNRHMAEVTYRPALDLPAVLRQQLPHIAEADTAALLMHLSALLPSMHNRYRREGVGEYLAAEYVFDTIGIAGEQIHTSIEARRAPAVGRATT